MVRIDEMGILETDLGREMLEFGLAGDQPLFDGFKPVESLTQAREGVSTRAMRCSSSMDFGTSRAV